MAWFNIYECSKYLLWTYHELAPVLGPGKTEVNTVVKKNSCLCGTYFLVGGQVETEDKQDKEVKYLVWLLCLEEKLS